MDVLGSDPFSAKLAGQLGARHITVERRLFADGEVCPRITQTPGNDVIIAQRLSLPLSPNRYLAEILLIVRALRMMKVENISVVMPYFIYSRQDRSFRPGEPFSASHILEILHDNGVKRFFTVASHMERFKPMLTATMPSYNIDGYSVLGEHLRSLDLKSPVIMGPDMTINMAAQRVASLMGAESCCIDKERNLDNGSLSVKELKMDFHGRDIVIVDDIISSGGTMLKAIEMAKRCNCGRIIVAAVHAVQEKGIERLKKHAWRIIASDTIDTPVSEISMIPALASKITDEGGTVDESSADACKERAKDISEEASSAFSWF